MLTESAKGSIPMRIWIEGRWVRRREGDVRPWTKACCKFLNDLYQVLESEQKDALTCVMNLVKCILILMKKLSGVKSGGSRSPSKYSWTCVTTDRSKSDAWKALCMRQPLPLKQSPDKNSQLSEATRSKAARFSARLKISKLSQIGRNIGTSKYLQASNMFCRVASRPIPEYLCPYFAVSTLSNLSYPSDPYIDGLVKVRV